MPPEGGTVIQSDCDEVELRRKRSSQGAVGLFISRRSQKGGGREFAHECARQVQLRRDDLRAFGLSWLDNEEVIPIQSRPRRYLQKALGELRGSLHAPGLYSDCLPMFQICQKAGGRKSRNLLPINDRIVNVERMSTVKCGKFGTFRCAME
jgi:hypothetical protein